MRAIPLLFAALLVAACTPLGRPPQAPRPRVVHTDAFDGDGPVRYARHSDRGDAWRQHDGMLDGHGVAIQSVLIAEVPPMTDGWVETETAHADDGGLVLGFRDNGNYLLLAVRDDAAPFPRGAENLKLYRRVEGRFETLWEADVAWPRGTRRTVRMEADGGRVRVYLDGALLSTRPVGAIRGGFGLRHYGDTGAWRVRYDVLRWSRLDSGEP